MAHTSPNKRAGVRRPTRHPALTLDQAIAFVAVAEAGTYREAARLLGIANHVAVIRLVARFTAVLGLGKLVNASRRGEVKLTPLGLRLLPAVQSMVEAAEAMNNIHDEIRFSSYPAITGRLVTAAPDLLEGEERVTVYDVKEDNRADGGLRLVERIRIGELDIVIASSGLRDKLAAVELDEHRLYRWQLEVVLPGDEMHEFFERPSIRPAQLAAFQIICAPVGHKSRELLERAFAEDRVPLSIATESANPDVLFQMAASSKAFAAVLPSDSFIRPPAERESARLGPQLVARRYRPAGHYSVYARKPVGEEPTERERSIERLATRVIEAFVSSGELCADLMRVARVNAGASFPSAGN
jgi:DNA-binding transcriptional LysR family regulator